MYIYVAPTGADTNDGSEGSPLQSFKGARDKIRSMQPDLPSGGITVYFRAGTYESPALKLTDEDSGTKDSPIVYTAYPGEKVIFSGAQKLIGWKKSFLGDSDIFHLRLRDLGIFDYEGIELFWNNRPMTVARYPNEGWMRIWHVDKRKNGGKDVCWVSTPPLASLEATQRTCWVVSRFKTVDRFGL